MIQYKFFHMKILLLIIFLGLQQFTSAQEQDCEIYNITLNHINNGRSNYIYFISDEKLDFPVNYLETFNSMQDVHFKWNDFSETRSDSINCIFDSLKYEICNIEKSYLFDIPQTVKFKNNQFIPVGVIFSPILYKENQFALLSVVTRWKPVPIAVSYFIFEHQDKWIIIDVKTEVH